MQDSLLFSSCYTPITIQNFVGRSYEQEKLHAVEKTGEASIVVIYGRRRIGKTELIERVYGKRNLLKFEGKEGFATKYQITFCIQKLAEYTGSEDLFTRKIKTWGDFFKVLIQPLSQGKWTLYFEELQWLATYKKDFISELKYYWDNYFRKNSELIIVLCGSAPSFMVKHVLQSQALHNRSQTEIKLLPFTISETKQFLGDNWTSRDAFDAHLTLGGIPEYLKRIKTASSIRLGIAEEAFVRSGFFVDEMKRLFVSSLAKHPLYEKIVSEIAKARFLTREDLLKILQVPSGGAITRVVQDLEECGFIESYSPFDATINSKKIRYRISDPYISFYKKFIEPQKKEITRGLYLGKPLAGFSIENYQAWLGLSFERYLAQFPDKIAHVLGFSGVRYTSGAFFQKGKAESGKGAQIDLIFKREDKTLTVCEIKYSHAPTGPEVIEDFEDKLKVLNEKNRTGGKNLFRIHKVLVSAAGQSKGLSQRGYFDNVLSLEDLIE